MGGSDPYELVNEIATALAETPMNFEAHQFSRSRFYPVIDSRFHYTQVGQQLDELTKDVDLVITTASTSSLEFLARGLRVGIVCAVDNQRRHYNSLGDLGVVAQLGVRTLDNDWELDKQKI